MSTIKALQSLDKETKASVYIVGGYVRDLLRNKDNSDLDIVVCGLQFDSIKKFLAKHGAVKEVSLAKTNENFGINILLFRGDDGVEAQITLPRRGKLQIPDSHNTLSQDVKFRDFKINSLYLPIGRGKRDIIDLVGGRDDIVNRRITSNGSPNERVKESPIRMMRAISLSCRTGYRISQDLIEAIKANAHLIKKCPEDGVRKELNRILLCKKPSKYLKLLDKVGLLEHIFPELHKCIGVNQDVKYHKYDVFNHLIYTCDNCPPDLKMRLAGLLHDVGKAETRRVVKATEGGEQRTTFHKHELVSTKLAKRFLSRLKYDNNLSKEVIDLVKFHMFHYTREWTDAAVRKFIRKVNIPEEYMTEESISKFPLFVLRSSERRGNGLKVEAVTDRQRDFEKKIIDIYRESNGLEIKDLDINGNIVMDTFRMSPGVQIGNLLKFLLDRVLENPQLNNRLDLLKLATEYLYNEKEKDNVAIN